MESSSSLSSPSFNYKLFSVTLSLPSRGDNVCNRNSKKESKKQEWESICKQWGLIISRELVFRSDDIFDEEINSERESRSNGNSVNSANSSKQPVETSPSSADQNTTIVIDGCIAVKVRDELIVSELIIEPPSADGSSNNESPPFSAAQNAGIQCGDIIHAIYGMQNPAFALLYGIMRDAVTFE